MEDIEALAEEFKACRKTLSAIGDENRQHLILEMMQMGNCGGVRVGAIIKNTSFLSGGIASFADPEGGGAYKNVPRRHKKLLLF